MKFLRSMSTQFLNALSSKRKLSLLELSPFILCVRLVGFKFRFTFIVTACIVSGAGSVYRYSVHPSICPSMDPRHQTCSRFAAVGPGGQEMYGQRSATLLEKTCATTVKFYRSRFLHFLKTYLVLETTQSVQGE